ncbi:uncharacterized protein [Parasteatoda tepidariorum]|uniref:uncharacterized protein n=1 Tax=Parasteatoda tepidariorum TaxID=114398 RepID=UPI0039BCB163
MLYFHLKDLHLGPQALLNSVCQRFWPIHGRNLARKIVHECVTCFKFRPVAIDQLISNLPSYRLNPEFTFNKSGLDFCAPFFVKQKNQREVSLQKIYVAVFVCLCTRAVHLEIVSDLTTESLIATLKRFLARRGKCSRLMSDNASNFGGARNELKRLYSLAQSPEQELIDYLLTEEVTWKFIPQCGPHFRGIWEATVKSFKTHF